jgi:hypothetical protein
VECTLNLCALCGDVKVLSTGASPCSRTNLNSETTPSKTEMDFIGSLLPIVISTSFSMRSATLILEPTSYISFFGLFWLPYHDDLPYCALRDGFVVGCISAVLSLLAPRFPRLLKAYSNGASPKLPFNGQKLLPKNPWWTIVFLTIGVGGWLGNFIGMSVPYRYMTGMTVFIFATALGIFILMQALAILWIYIRHYPERLPLGLVTGILWPPLHPAHRFLMRTGNRLRCLLETSNSSEAGEPGEQND